MSSTEIAEKARKIQKPTDLLALVNKINAEEYDGRVAIEPAVFFGLCNPSSPAPRYHTFCIRKKTGGIRQISAPTQQLKTILRPIKDILASLYAPKACVMGFTNGKSVADNATAHIGQNYILNLDLKDFFPSIDQARVWKRLQLPPYNFPQKIASNIAGLCSIKVVGDDGTVRFVLPQGAPTSPILTNIICENLDRRLLGVASRFHLRYTRYADDITFSCMHSALSLSGEAFAEIKRVIEDQGFTINEKKTRLQKRGSRQEVTGLIVSERINVTRDYVRELDQILYVWKKFGYKAASLRLLKSQDISLRRRKQIPSLKAVVVGKLNYLRMIKGSSNSVYTKYRDLFLQCVREKPSEEYQGEVAKYLLTYSLFEFKKALPGSLSIDSVGLRGTLSTAGVVFKVGISKKARKLIRKNNHSRESRILFISLCSGPHGLFWMIHPELPPQEQALKLVLPLEKLLKIWEENGLDAAIKANNIALLKNKVPKRHSFNDLLKQLLWENGRIKGEEVEFEESGVSVPKNLFAVLSDSFREEDTDLSETDNQ